MGKKILLLLALLVFAVAAHAQPACSANSECDDSSPKTLDYCQRPMAENSGCSNLSCVVACATDADCDDKDGLTVDVCAGAGRCSAVCSHLELCGNGAVDPGETSCNCPQDAGSCGGEAPGTCREIACVGETCGPTLALGCCGNNICEFREDYSTCSADCKAKNLQIEITGASESDYYIRGEEVRVKATITADGVPIKDATVEIEGFFGKLQLLNDGHHGDANPFDNAYGNTLAIPENIEADTYPVTINAVFENNRGIKTFSLKIDPKLELRLNISKESIFLGDEISVSGIVSKKTAGIKSSVALTVYSNGIRVAQENAESNDLGEFSYSYRTSFLDSEGEWKIEAFTKDGLENTGYEEKKIKVSASEITAFLNVNIAKELKETYVRGENALISITVTDKGQKPVGGAKVSVLVPKMASLALQEKDGLYEGMLQIGRDFPLGKQEIKITALKTDQNDFFAGTATIKFGVEATQIALQLVSPKATSVQIGDEIEFRVLASYGDQSPVILSKIDSNVNGKTISLNAVERGVYSGKYIVSENDSPKIFFGIYVDDSFGNTAFSSQEIEVSGYSAFHYLRRFGLQLVFGAILIVVIGGALFFIMSKQRRILGLEKEAKHTIEEIKKIQQEYFKEATLDRKNYERLLDKYESKLQDIRKTAAQLKEKK